MVMSLHDDGAAITGRWNAAAEGPGQSDAGELFRYTYLPSDRQMESPRPYFHPVRTLGGDLVTLYRPHDHVWHKGIALSLPNMGPENFWGGATYRRGDAYIQLANNGTMRHDGFDLAVVKDDVALLDERLTWVTESGQLFMTEHRVIAVTAWPADSAWGLSFETTLRNISGGPVRIGSPTTEGRENAGYGGLFWRGPRSFTGGRVVTPRPEAQANSTPRPEAQANSTPRPQAQANQTQPGPDGGDEVMGLRGPWLGFAGQHDDHGRWSTLVFRDSPENFSYPSQWFVRTTPFACVCPAPFFDAEHPMPEGESLTLRYDIAVADGKLDPDACARLAEHAAALDLPAADG